ncbi:MAG: hypothetical protein IIC82_08775 [Chloroflexi bacterium]|nr:hypothetical protein [Chloroflexota bacterium]
MQPDDMWCPVWLRESQSQGVGGNAFQRWSAYGYQMIVPKFNSQPWAYTWIFTNPRRISHASRQVLLGDSACQMQIMLKEGRIATGFQNKYGVRWRNAKRGASRFASWKESSCQRASFF